MQRGGDATVGEYQGVFGRTMLVGQQLEVVPRIEEVLASSRPSWMLGDRLVSQQNGQVAFVAFDDHEAMLHLKSPKRIALVAVDPIHNAVIGIAVAGLTPPEAELETIAVAAGWQRRGIARELFGAVADALRREQITEIHLEVRASNGKAVRFYRARGFGETGRRPRYYADPVEDAILMSLLLGDLGR